MNIKQFAGKYRVKTRRDPCDGVIIHGKRRKTKWPGDKRLIYEQGDG